MSATEFDPANLSDFASHLFEVLRRFRNVAVENHTGSGETLEDVQYHETSVMDASRMVRQYEPPVVFSLLSDYSGEADTISKDHDVLTVDVATFTWDYDRDYGFEDAVRIMAKVIDNVEANRSLESSPGAGDPVATDVSWDSLEADFQFSDDRELVVHWASTTFQVETERIRPT